jgi:acetylornithine deacetylase/succinyl-diaminopimelate desuccinylase-like protein
MSEHKPDAAIDIARSQRVQALNSLQELLRIPSVSALPERRADVQRAAEWIAARFLALGFTKTEVIATGGHPVISGERMDAGAGAPTILFYGHYDVQPADPLNEWTSGPFEPEVRGENLYARGASDMKGQLVAFLAALEAMQKAGTRLPVNLKLLVEGEEEIGSASLPPLLTSQRERFTCDYCLNSDAGILAPDQPSLTYGLRGLAYFELRVQGPSHDLHSGSFGGAVDNPVQVLFRLIDGMKDERGRVTLQGFYDRVRPLPDEERAELAKLPDNEAWWRKATGAPALFGEEGYSSRERAGCRPTLDVNGVSGGFEGEGSKTVLPGRAMVKFSMRLVPDQDPEEVRKSVIAYLKEKAPPTVTWELIQMAGFKASVTERNGPAVRAAAGALERVWGKPPLFTRSGGSVPVVGHIQELLGVDSVLLGFGLPDDNLHAPNEKLHLPNFYRGIEAYIHFLCLAGR